MEPCAGVALLGEIRVRIHPEGIRAALQCCRATWLRRVRADAGDRRADERGENLGSYAAWASGPMGLALLAGRDIERSERGRGGRGVYMASAGSGGVSYSGGRSRAGRADSHTGSDGAGQCAAGSGLQVIMLSPFMLLKNCMKALQLSNMRSPMRRKVTCTSEPALALCPNAECVMRWKAW